jgi:soluble lytic murein transglycosylase-like protein
MKTALLLIIALSSTSVASSSGNVPSISDALNLPPKLLNAVCLVESGGDSTKVHRHDGTSDSLGLCQVKLSTARFMGFRGTKRQLMDARTNEIYAARYLKYQANRYHHNYAKALTAYNQGSCYSEGNSVYAAKVFNAWGKLL